MYSEEVEFQEEEVKGKRIHVEGIAQIDTEGTKRGTCLNIKLLARAGRGWTGLLPGCWGTTVC